MSERSPKVKKAKIGVPNAKVESTANQNHSAINTPQSALANQLQTENRSPQTEPMEVHHHPQLEHKPKPWKEYLLEGFMIFVAVTMGFFAESLREHIANKDKGKEVIASLVRDLKKDTATLNGLIAYIPFHNSWVDSADSFINTLPIKGNERKITMAIFNATDWDTYAPPEVALNNLKSSGTFNLIEKEKVKSEILNFNTRINEYIKYSEFVTVVEHCVDTASTSLIGRKAQHRLVERLYINTAENRFGFVSLKDIPDDMTFKTYNKLAFTNFLRKVEQADNLLNDMLGWYKRIYAAEANLLKTLKEEYHLEDE